MKLTRNNLMILINLCDWNPASFWNTLKQYCEKIWKEKNVNNVHLGVTRIEVYCFWRECLQCYRSYISFSLNALYLSIYCKVQVLFIAARGQCLPRFSKNASMLNVKIRSVFIIGFFLSNCYIACEHLFIVH